MKKKYPDYYNDIDEANRVIAELRKQLAINKKRLQKLRGVQEPNNAKMRIVND